MKHSGRIHTTFLTERSLSPEHRTVCFITGMKHSGKTSAAMYVAQRTGSLFADSDALILEDVRDVYASIRECYRTEGKKAFMDREFQAVSGFLDAHLDEDLCISLGGGACDNRKLMDLCRASGVIVVLREPADALYARIVEGGIPPFFDPLHPRESFAVLYEQRNTLYNAFGDAIIDKSDISVEQMLREVHREILRIRERYYGWQQFR